VSILINTEIIHCTWFTFVEYHFGMYLFLLVLEILFAVDVMSASCEILTGLNPCVYSMIGVLNDTFQPYTVRIYNATCFSYYSLW